jgi:hypothetical protein
MEVLFGLGPVLPAFGAGLEVVEAGVPAGVTVHDPPSCGLFFGSHLPDGLEGVDLSDQLAVKLADALAVLGQAVLGGLDVLFPEVAIVQDPVADADGLLGQGIRLACWSISR